MAKVSIIVMALLLALASPAGAEKGLNTLKASAFSFRFRPPLAPAAQELAAAAGQVREAIDGHLGQQGPEVEVLLAGSFKEFQGLQPQGVQAPPWAIGTAFPSLRLMVLNVGLGPNKAPVDILPLFRHEYSHLALGHLMGKRKVPRWFNEGFALYQSREWSFERARILTNASISNSLLPLADLDRSFPRDSYRAQLAYAQSVQFLIFISEEFGPKPFHRLIALLFQGEEFLKAVERAYAMPLKRLERLWITDIKRRYTWIPVLTSSATLWLIITLIFLAAFIKKRRQSAQRRQEEDMEEEEEFLH